MRKLAKPFAVLLSAVCALVLLAGIAWASNSLAGYDLFALVERTAPATPAAGIGHLYAAEDGTLHYLNDSADDTELGAGGGGGFPIVGGSSTVLDEVSDGLLSIKESTAADDISNFGHDGTDGVWSTDSGGQQMTPASGTTQINGELLYVKGSGATTLFRVFDVNEDGLLVTTSAGKVTVSSENSTNTDIWFGNATAGLAYDTGSHFVNHSTKGLKTFVSLLVRPSGDAMTVLESWTHFTNEGATSTANFVLPTLTGGNEDGVTYTFMGTDDSDLIRITANTNDTISIDGTVSAGAGFVECVTAGADATITLVSVSASEWIATTHSGAWTVDGTPAASRFSAVLTGRVLQNHTAADTLTMPESNKVNTNLGDGDMLLLTLPADPTTGTIYVFFVAAAEEFRIDPDAGDKIVDADMTGLADGEYTTSTTLGSSITLVAMSDDDWAVIAKTGTWTEETP